MSDLAAVMPAGGDAAATALRATGLGRVAKAA
jgi:hypothetical protein